MNKQKIKIDIVSDINCPWCYLGEQRLKKAIAETADAYEFELSFKPYELNPSAPQEGELKEDYFIRNYGAEAMPRLNASSRQLEKMGKEEGAEFNFDKATVVHNTFNGHRLIWLAEQYGVQEQVAHALFKANFTEGQNVNNLQVLTEIGVAHGIPADRLESFFSSDEGKDEVKSLERWAQKSGISGVPAFIFNDKFLVSGAQPAETLKQVFSQVTPKLQPLDVSGESCSIDGSC
ncbi:polyketide biosynthesis dithiol-disulfide isomerase [Flammeovirgaceae bacterium 311]|nr:polyketide biosynthesis dithiol-disulfide isomerase [Flammeovirgaceae bacterium 311]